METKICHTCNEELALRNFSSCKGRSLDHNDDCRKCRSIKRNKDKHNKGCLLLCLKCGEYKNLECFNDNINKHYRQNKDSRCKDCKSIQYSRRKLQNRGKKDLDRLLLERWYGVRDRAKRKGLIIDFNWEFLKELWIKQKGICVISGIQMTYIMSCGRVPTNVSVDRIDPSIGYIRENIQLVCMTVNQMKSDLSISELLGFCSKIIKNNNYES
jgi:hypothetical protein